MKKYQLQKSGWIGLGAACGGIGSLGIVVPLLPTTPFVLLAAMCFTKSSPRLHRWLITHKTLGPYLMRYEQKTPFSRRQKTILLVWLWCGLAFSYLCMQRMAVVPILLLVGILVSIHVLKDPRPDCNAAGGKDVCDV